MTDEIKIKKLQQNCCRLCLAPDSECVPIFTSFAADKEPLSSKIHACVNIKVNESDRLSSRICHSCISYLNSWQSFKNRCIASQLKQRNWLEMAKKTAKKQFDHKRLGGRNSQQTNRTSIISIGNTQCSPSFKSKLLPTTIKVKDEPKDNEEDDENKCNGKMQHDIEETVKVDVDPTEFLERNEENEEEEEVERDSTFTSTLPPPKASEGPQILTSLGLTHIKSVNPFSFLSTELGNNEVQQKNDINNTTTTPHSTPTTSVNESELNKSNAATLPTACRICKVSFSTRANAKRHERNIHGKTLDSPLLSSPKFNIKQNVLKRTSQPPNSEMMGIYDYQKSEKYRHLLTEQKILYIRRNEDFLKQYQNLTCKCCSKIFPTYKNFMAHMRKKYPNLGRNLCFKCLKQFQTRAMFVSHLKKRNCINLYKVYLNDENVSKQDFGNLSADKMGAKELLTNKVYECKICSKTSRLKMEFRAHVYDEHSEIQKKDVPPGSCGFCGLEIDDPVDRKRHYNNMECIVFLKCVTCEEKFDNHQKFVEHVYGAHLPQHLANNNEEDAQSSNVESGTEIKDEMNVGKVSELKVNDPRMPQSCQICGQHYNNYNNVLRHMEAKHPNQLPPTYKCTKCDVGYPRMSMLRNHMLDAHQSKLPKSKKDGIFCRMCSETFDVSNKWICHQTDHHSRYTCCQCNYQNKSLEEFKKHIEIHPNLASKTTTTTTTITTNTTSNRYDYVMKDLLSITNGCQAAAADDDDQDHDNEKDEVKNESSYPKKMKMDTDYKECHICHSVFTGNLGLSNHMRTHNTQEHAKRLSLLGTKLSVSNDGSPNKIENRPKLGGIKRELEVDARFRRMRCRICQRRFSTKKSYRRHMLIDHHVRNVPFMRCSICHGEFTHEKGLKVHMFKAHGTIMSGEDIEIQFECDVCSTVYRNEEQLNAHKKSVHEDGDEIEPPLKDPHTEGNTSSGVATNSSPKYWFQCRYCPSNFDTNKKLAIHINSHEEFDSNDYSCKDCGNVYSGRKSLWVHRYKKHPLVADPAPCSVCNKTFFDKKMLEIHLKTHNEADINESKDKSLDVSMTTTLVQNFVKNDHNDHENDHKEKDSRKQKIGMLQVSCSVCGEKFSDQELFSKHMQMHENELYTDNPLAAMFDTGPEDPNRFFMSRMGEDGAYVCDLCPKRFPNITSLKVHRNWHFRSDSKQTPADPNSVWKVTNKRRKNAPTHRCNYCNSTFVSSSNLRRHIGELHKREIANGVEPPEVFIEKHLECQKCRLKFQNRSEWIEHKIGHVKVAKHDATFEWGCEICGKLVSRKERLIQHMNSHLREEETNGNASFKEQGNNEAEFENNSEDNSMGSSNEENIENDVQRNVDNSENDKKISAQNSFPNSDKRNSNKVGDEEDDDGDGGDDDDDNDDDDNNNNDDEGDDERLTPSSSSDDEDHDDSPLNSSSSDDEDRDDSDTEDEDGSEDDDDDNDENAGPYSCDLCQVFFETSKQLQRHVTSHFLNGPGSVTLTEIPKEKNLSREDNIRSST